MLWLAGVLAGPPGSDSRRPLVLAACDCAELAKAYWTPGDERPANALRVARSWARQEGATLDDVELEAEAAAALATRAVEAALATRAAEAAGAARATRAVEAALATRAARATRAVEAALATRAAEATRAVEAALATRAAEAAGALATRAAEAAGAAAAAVDARQNVLAECAGIVRQYYPRPPSMGKVSK